MKKVSIFVVLVLAFASCKHVLFEEEPAGTAPVVFQEAWDFVNEKYTFFELKNLDWDSAYQAYQPLVYDGMSNDSLFNVLSDLLYLLKDGHVNLSAGFDFSRNWSWYLDYPVNYDEDLLERHYFLEQQQFMGPLTLFDFGDVGYMHYSSFSRSVSQDLMANVYSRFSDKKGLIIDVRDNGGGAVFNVYEMISLFVQEEMTLAVEQVKDGPDRDHFTGWKDLRAYPNENEVFWSKPVVILTNRKCYSATNLFVAMMSALPNVTIVGDQSGGGGGVPAYTQLSNRWILRVSASQTYTLDGKDIELGVPADVSVDMDSTDQQNGMDSILEKALELIRQ